MIDDAALSNIQAEYDFLKREHSIVSRKYSRLEREYENLTHLYKQAVALRDYNEKEKETQMCYNQMLRENCPDDMFLLDTDMRILLCTSSVKAYLRDVAPQIEGRDFLQLLNEVYEEAFILQIATSVSDVKASRSSSYFNVDALKRSGESVYFSVSIAPALGVQGELTGIAPHRYSFVSAFWNTMYANEDSSEFYLNPSVLEKFHTSLSNLFNETISVATCNLDERA